MMNLKVLKEFIKFYYLYEPIPYKNLRYADRIIKLRQYLLDARVNNDQKVIWQHRCLLIIVTIVCFHFIYLSFTKFDNEYDAHTYMDFMSWIHLPKQLFVCLSLIYFVTLYFALVIYYNWMGKQCFQWLAQIAYGHEFTFAHWPFHYKFTDCRECVKKRFIFVMSAFQPLVVIIGKYQQNDDHN